jgi:tRNA nucleotidyltransferase/poly(A) polymerase
MKAFFVGGTVRDALMGIRPRDFDVVVLGGKRETLATAQRFANHFGVAAKLHFATGTASVVVYGVAFDFATPRQEVKGEIVSFINETIDPICIICEDASRRDFTVNAMYAPTSYDELVHIATFGAAAFVFGDRPVYDFYDGRSHLKQGLIVEVDDINNDLERRLQRKRALHEKLGARAMVCSDHVARKDGLAAQ